VQYRAAHPIDAADSHPVEGQAIVRDGCWIPGVYCEYALPATFEPYYFPSKIVCGKRDRADASI
jgi:hypothetical protein